MRLIIENKSKLETFVGIFQLLKNWSSHINMQFEKDKLYIQSIDKSHTKKLSKMITDVQLAVFCNVLGVTIFLLVVLYHYVSVNGSR